MNIRLTNQSYETRRKIAFGLLDATGIMALLVSLLVSFFFASPLKAEDTIANRTQSKKPKVRVQSAVFNTDSTVGNNINAILGGIKVAQLSADTVTRSNVIIKVLGESINVEIDTNDVPFDSILAAIDKSGGDIKFNKGSAIAISSSSEDDDGLPPSILAIVII